MSVCEVKDSFWLGIRSSFEQYKIGDAKETGLDALGEFNSREEAIKALNTDPIYMNSIHILTDSISVFETYIDGYRSGHTVVCRFFTNYGAVKFNTFEEAKQYVLKQTEDWE